MQPPIYICVFSVWNILYIDLINFFLYVCYLFPDFFMNFLINIFLIYAIRYFNIISLYTCCEYSYFEHKIYDPIRGLKSEWGGVLLLLIRGILKSSFEKKNDANFLKSRLQCEVLIQFGPYIYVQRIVIWTGPVLFT